MNCQAHPHKIVSSRCQNCSKFICSICSPEHHRKKHLIRTMIELSENAQHSINTQLEKIDNKIKYLSTIGDYQMGESVIQSCQAEIVDYINQLFEQIKSEYRHICDEYWQVENEQALGELEEKRQNLIGWANLIKDRKQKVQEFQETHILKNNRVQTEEDLLESTHSYVSKLEKKLPKIQFNQTALRRAHESLSKVIYISGVQQNTAKGFVKHTKSLKRSPSRRSNRSSGNAPNSEYQSLCKFIEGTSLLYEFILHDPSSEQNEPFLNKIQFRQFKTPMRSVSISEGGSIFLIGGHNRQKKASKQIWTYERSYNTMRIVGLLREARAGHSACSNSDILYIFGGSENQTLEQFDTKNKSGKILGEYKKKLSGSSTIYVKDKIYIFGGVSDLELNNLILIFDLIQQKWEQMKPYNMSSYSMPISPLLCSFGEEQILILGGYFTSTGQSISNMYCCSFNMTNKYFSQIGKGQIIYPLISSTQSCMIKNGKLFALAELRRERNRHGPNLPALLTYNFKEDSLILDTFSI